MFLRTLSTFACTTLLATVVHAQGMSMGGASGKSIPSPPATASVTLGGSAITVSYGAPSMRGRVIMGGVVPYDQVWRTGANPATTLVTPVDLNIGTLMVPAGTYTLFTLPTASQWMLIVSKKTGEWGIPYPEGNDLGRVPMKSKTAGTPQEVMSITFENTTGKRTEMHVRWEKTDEFVPVSVAK